MGRALRPRLSSPKSHSSGSPTALALALCRRRRRQLPSRPRHTVPVPLPSSKFRLQVLLSDAVAEELQELQKGSKLSASQLGSQLIEEALVARRGGGDPRQAAIQTMRRLLDELEGR